MFGHVDFFKNNLWFAHTNRKMLDQMANHATKHPAASMDKHGHADVEAFIDLSRLSLDNLIDPYMPHIRRHRDAGLRGGDRGRRGRTGRPDPGEVVHGAAHQPAGVPRGPAPAQGRGAAAKMRSFPEEPVRDVMGFLLQHAQRCRAGSRRSCRSSATRRYYFAPQGQTKIMNEGWATYWHTKMMTRHILSDSEVIDYCRPPLGHRLPAARAAQPLQDGRRAVPPHRGALEQGPASARTGSSVTTRASSAPGTPARGSGARRSSRCGATHNDITFLDTFLTADFCREQGFFTTKYDPKAGEWLVDSHEFEDIKRQLLMMLATRGTPRVYVVDGNHRNRGDLRLWHQHEGVDIQLDWASVTMQNLVALWGRPVHLDTSIEGKPIRLSHDGTEGKRIKREAVDEEEEEE